MTDHIGLSNDNIQEPFAYDDQSPEPPLLGAQHPDSQLRSKARGTVLDRVSSGQRPWFLSPKFLAIAISVFVVVVSVVIIVVVTTVGKHGKNQDQVVKLIEAAKASTVGYSRLSEMLQLYGSRIGGSQSLNNSINWMANVMRNQDGFDVSLDPVNVSEWVRGAESATLIQPFQRNLIMLGLGRSIGTPPQGIQADVIVVDSFDELDSVKSQVPGKIVLFNAAWAGSYGGTVAYRSRGATTAAKYGAVACLIRSVTPYSLQTAHTGLTSYQDGFAIPVAAITVEDSQWLRSIYDRGQQIVVNLKMEAHMVPGTTTAYNILGEIKGSQYPDQYIVMGGHIDSWDVGQGAHDDAGGVFAAWEAIRLIKATGLVPKRTIRVVGWTDEEQTQAGANEYPIIRAKEVPNTVLAMESDTGTFKPVTLLYAGTDKGFAGASKMASYYLTKYLGVNVVRSQGADTDIMPLLRAGVPCFSLRNEWTNTKYFWYHHTEADTVDHIDPVEFNLNVATFATVAWVASELEWPLK